MTNRILVVTAVIVAAAGPATAQPAPSPPPTVPDSGQFSIYKLQHRVGSETWRRRHVDPAVAGSVASALTAEWAFRYIGSAVSLRETLTQPTASKKCAPVSGNVAAQADAWPRVLALIKDASSRAEK